MKLLGVVGVIVGLHSMIAGAATNSVGSYTSLINAIANSANGDTIVVTNNIMVSNQVSINNLGLTIQGNNYSISVPVSGLNASGIVNTSPSAFGVFNISTSGLTNTIQNLTIEGGAPAGQGGGILNSSGTLILQGVTITQSGGVNTTGGGVWNGGTLYMSNCNISRNGAEYGGGFLSTGTMFIQGCTISENRSMISGGGGGGGQNNGTLYANNSTFANNVSTELGGAINNRTSASAYFVDCTFVGNVAFGTGYMGGAIANNGGTVSLVNTLLAYNYYYNGSSFTLNDITNYTGAPASAPLAYYCIFQSTTNQLASGSVGTTLYTGNISGANNTLFCGGASTMVLSASGSQVGSGTVFQPFLVNVGLSQTATAVLKPGSFAFGYGARAAFSSAPSTPVAGYYNGSAWVTLSGTSSASYEVTTDQNTTNRGSLLTVGAAVSTATNVFMLQVNAGTNGTVSGGTIYGDIYPSGTTITLTAIPNAGYEFSQWNYVLGGSGVASTVNPFAITLTTNVTLVPVFALYTGFTVSYSGNGATGGTVPAAQVVSSGGSTNISGPGTMVNPGYLFSCWNTRSDGNGTNYATNAVYSGPGNLNLYAIWTPCPPPTITTSPTNQTVAVGAPVNISVSPTGATPLYYQWFKNGAMVIGATNSTLSFASAATTNSGVYYVTVTNAYGMCISQPASVTVGVPQLFAWGNNSYGQLGDGTATSRSLPESMASNVVTATLGADHSLFLKNDGTLWGTGFNGDGELGDTNTTSTDNAVFVSSNVVAAAGGVWHSLFVKNNGTLWAMGQNYDGQLGNGTTSTSPQTVPLCVASNVVAVAAGYEDSLYLKNDGTLWAMGDNAYGQLGDGTTITRSNAVFVSSNVVAVMAGYQHSLYLKNDGSLWAMGYNAYGQLGDGTMVNRSNAVSVASNVVAIAAGDQHSLYLKNDGSLRAMGYNSYGELGDGTTATRSNAVSVASNVVAVTAGYEDSLYLKNDGSLWAMGVNYYGELGNGTTVTPASPVSVPGMSLANIFSGNEAFHTLAIGLPLSPSITSQPTNQTVVAGGSVTFTVTATGFAPLSYQWQFNGTNISAATAASYTLTGAMATNAGNYSVVVSNSPGSVTSSVATLTVNRATPTVTTWPTASTITYGQTLASSILSGGIASVGGTFAFTTPTNAPGLGTAAQGVAFTPADAADYNTVSNTVSVTVSMATPSITTWPTATAITYGQTLASSTLSGGVASTGGTFAFVTPTTAPGAGTAPQWFSFTPTNTTDYNTISSLVNVTVNKAAATVTLHPTPLLATYDGTAKAVTATTTPSGLAVAITYNGQSAAPTNAGAYTVIATVTDPNYMGGATNQLRIAIAGPAVAWGLGSSGQMGNGGLTNNLVPGAIITNGVMAGKTIVAVAGGVSHSYALTSDGMVYAWGDDSMGQLGNNGTSASDVPVMVYTNGVLAGKKIVAIASGQSHALALSADGMLFTWGWNNNLQLGNGSTVAYTNVPVAVNMTGVLAGETVVALGTGNMHNLAATSDGKLFAWGYGQSGQLGNGGMTNCGVPVAVNMSGALSGKSVIAASGGWLHSVALTADGLVYAWGAGGSAQLGDGALTNSSVPVAVATNGVLAGQTIVAIGSGEFHCLAVSATGSVYSWGPSPDGELGNGTNIQSTVPVAVSSNGALAGKTVVAVCGSYNSSTALTADGEVFTWGANGYGQLGNTAYPINSYVPVAVSTNGALAGQTVLAISSSSQAFHVIALTVGLAAPALTSATNATGTYGQAFTFTVTGNSVASYSAAGLPGWAAFNMNTGVLSGTPTNTGVFNVAIVATNAFGSTGGNLAITILPATTAVSVGSSLNPATYGASVTFTATVSPGAAGGTVTFMDGTTNLGAGTLSGGTATFAANALGAGSHSITATYGGNTNYAASTSTPITQVVVGQRPVVVEIVNNGNSTVTATFQGSAGAAYVVFASTNLCMPGSWSAVSTNLAGSGGTWTYTGPIAGWQQRFFIAAPLP